MARAKAVDHDEKRSNILNKASELFTAEGFSRASMTQLAQACEISKANLYHYYPDKESILFHLLDEHMDEILQALRKSFEKSPPEERLHRQISTLLTLYQNADHKHRILLNDLQILPQDKQDTILGKEREIVQFFKNAILLKYPQHGSNPKILAASAMTILGAINWSFTWFKPGKGFTIDQYAQFLTRTFEQGIGHASND
ncbi:MAG: TetR/AcrR family transcriptional regulator [Cardiobacteriaceae bacterium]|nr:TetR/AcrR family transcriptional regulator [Cardiobacteriaceae bacterium]